MVFKAALLLIKLQRKASNNKNGGAGNNKYSHKNIRTGNQRWEVDVGQGCIFANRTAEETIKITKMGQRQTLTGTKIVHHAKSGS
jgi:hypothetical protein